MADRRLFQDVADRIVEMMREGVFPPGTRLPGERELAERLGVSRVTIREAEIALQAVGHVTIKTGSGVFVAEKSAFGDGEIPAVSAFELTEARSLFEADAAALAAPIIDEPTLARLDELVEIMRTSKDEASDEADREFHMTIAAASGNKVIVHVVNTLWRMRTELPEVRNTHEAVCQNDARSRVDEHRAIVEALRQRDPAAARLNMRRHFNRLLEAMLDVTEEQDLRELRRKAEKSRERYLMSMRLG